MYIYKTTNLLNDKIYIGKKVYRKKDDNWYLGSGIYLNRAIKKYGRENFKKEILTVKSVWESNEAPLFSKTSKELLYKISKINEL